jgi:hypothetical protein
MKKISEYTERELMEKIAINSKITSDAVTFIKTFFIATAIVFIALAIFIVVK